MKVEFRGYTNKNGDFDGGYGEVLQYLATLNDKDATAQVDYDMTYECVDIIAPSLKIKNLNFEQKDDKNNFIATFDTTKKSRDYVIKLLVSLAKAGNCGHSYGVRINKEKLYIDGDGADYLPSINGIKINSLKGPYEYGKISNKETENIETNKLNISEEKLNNIIKESIIRHLNKL